MSHAAKPTLFCQRLQNSLAAMAQKAQCIPVMVLPRTTSDAMLANRRKLGLFGSSLDEDQKDLVLCMMNSDWSSPVDEQSLVHICTPDCCKDEADFRKRMATALHLVYGGFFETPLLYRWKHWEPAAEFAARGMAVHGLLATIWRCCMSEAADQADNITIDEDDADGNPAAKQKVRMSKVQKMLDDHDAGAPCHDTVTRL